MKIITANGIELDADGGMARTITSYARQKGLKNVVCVTAKHPDGQQEYILLRNNKPIFASQKAEDVGCHVDILALVIWQRLCKKVAN